VNPFLDPATVVRTKNATPFSVTIDIFFADEVAYSAASESGELTAELVARAYQVDIGDVEGPFWVRDALAAKVTVPKRWTAGSARCSDILGGHLHTPVLAALVAARGER
jgi:hypothetical protein